jgi:hypothetical protein
MFVIVALAVSQAMTFSVLVQNQLNPPKKYESATFSNDDSGFWTSTFCRESYQKRSEARSAPRTDTPAAAGVSAQREASLRADRHHMGGKSAAGGASITTSGISATKNT